MVSSEIVIEALDVRLRRLEFILTGSTDSKTPQNDVSNGGDGGGNIPRQLASLNERLTRLANGNKSIKKLLQACTIPLYMIFISWSPLHPLPTRCFSSL